MNKVKLMAILKQVDGEIRLRDGSYEDCITEDQYERLIELILEACPSCQK